MMQWIDPGWLDRKNEIAQSRDVARGNEWRNSPWYIKILIWLSGDSPNGRNHRKDWELSHEQPEGSKKFTAT